MVKLMAFMDTMRHQHPDLDGFYYGPERLLRLQLASRVDWNQLYNRRTRTTWLARLRGKRLEASFVKEVRHQLDGADGGARP